MPNPTLPKLCTLQFDYAHNHDGPLNMFPAIKLFAIYSNTSTSTNSIIYWKIHTLVYNNVESQKHITWHPFIFISSKQVCLCNCSWRACWRSMAPLLRTLSISIVCTPYQMMIFLFFPSSVLHQFAIIMTIAMMAVVI